MNPELGAHIQPGEAQEQFVQRLATNLLVVRVTRVREIGDSSFRVVLEWFDTPPVSDNDKLVDLVNDARGKDFSHGVEGAP